MFIIHHMPRRCKHTEVRVCFKYERYFSCWSHIASAARANGARLALLVHWVAVERYGVLSSNAALYSETNLFSYNLLIIIPLFFTYPFPFFLHAYINIYV
uniref:Uncharacterized protein n=1 Tax=Trypanosoma vivax (strain Y486) TaxID=1055687 RepID=G0U5C8_TRYVY|nr:hypothetical protein TVY486_1001300 [Trypanosoma vivax Y486]